MLAYFKQYKIASYLISFLGPLVVIGIVLLATGVNLMSGVAGGLVWLVCMIALMFATSRIFGRKADEEAERMLALYNQECDPVAFQDEGRAVATVIYEDCFAHGTTELGAWFLAPYALACADLGSVEDAEMMEKALIDGMDEGIGADERAGIIVNLEPLTLRLHGADAALSLALQAQSLLAESADPDASSKKSYLGFEIPLLQALVAGDTATLLPRFQRVRTSESNPMRIRVLDADAEAAIHEAAGQPDAQREALDFVVKNGNKLPVVEAAKAKLAQL